MPTFPKGHYAHLTRLANAKHIAHLNTTPNPQPTTTRFAFPDPVNLRGIPALAQGVGGTIPGTQPEQATCR